MKCRNCQKPSRRDLCRGVIALLFATTLSAAPFDHPNYAPSLPEPVIPITYDLSLSEIQRQNPQFAIYFTGGLVGYFGAIPKAPVWTTPWTPWPDRPDESERVYNLPTPGCTGCLPGPEPLQHSIPEPAAWLLVAAGLVVVWRRRCSSC